MYIYDRLVKNVLLLRNIDLFLLTKGSPFCLSFPALHIIFNLKKIIVHEGETSNMGKQEMSVTELLRKSCFSAFLIPTDVRFHFFVCGVLDCFCSFSRFKNVRT